MRNTGACCLQQAPFYSISLRSQPAKDAQGVPAYKPCKLSIKFKKMELFRHSSAERRIRQIEYPGWW